MDTNIGYDDFDKVEIRIGTVLAAEDLPEARKPAFVLTVDFGEYGVLKSSSRITDLYTKDDMVGRQVLAVTNLLPRQVGKVMSQCLVLGFYTGEGGERVVLASAERPVENGSRLL
jgi:tRNA-binding protein